VAVLDVNQWLASGFGRLTPGDNPADTHCIVGGGSVGPRARLDVLAKRKMSSYGVTVVFGHTHTCRNANIKKRSDLKTVGARRVT
jgi:hypothetical protein